jgi:hypothetical protein
MDKEAGIWKEDVRAFVVNNVFQHILYSNHKFCIMQHVASALLCLIQNIWNKDALNVNNVSHCGAVVDALEKTFLLCFLGWLLTFKRLIVKLQYTGTFCGRGTHHTYSLTLFKGYCAQNNEAFVNRCSVSLNNLTKLGMILLS